MYIDDLYVCVYSVEEKVNITFDLSVPLNTINILHNMCCYCTIMVLQHIPYVQ